MIARARLTLTSLIMSAAAPAALAGGLLLTACSPATPGPDAATDAGRRADAGTATDAGAGGTTDAGSGEIDAGMTGDADAGPQVALGESCVFGSDECGAGRVCTSIFTGADGMLDRSTSTCFDACADLDLGDACQAAHGLDGVCRDIQDAGKVCVHLAPLLGPCGNGANASCATTPVCLLAPGAGVGVCAKACNPADKATCRALAPGQPGCGCDESEACSTSPIGVTLQGGDTDGVCTPPSQAGDPCTSNPLLSGQAQLCSDGQVCGAAEMGSETGVCQEQAMP